MEKKKMVKCVDLLENVKDKNTRDWFLNEIGGENREIVTTNMGFFPHSEEDVKFKGVFHEKDGDIDKLFSITNGQNQDKEHERINAIIKQGTFDNQIQGGIYNVFMPDKNTYFHSAIASDLTKSTLEILKHIKKVADKKGRKLEDLVPFKQMDSGKYGPKKNFLMLAIAKKYDNDELKVNYIQMTQAEYEKQKKSIETCMKFKIVTEEEIKQFNEKLEQDFAQGGKTIMHKEYHKEAYQKYDAELIKWLIDNAPDDCLQQKDGEGYNIVDYALMKMDKDILDQLLQKDNEKNLGLLKNSKLLKEIYCNNFNYEEASEMVKKRYGVTQAIANTSDWELQKKDVLGVLNAYIDNCKDAELKKIKSMAAESNLKNALNRDMHFGIKG